MGTIVVFGAGGRAGRRAVAEARARGHEVTAVVRDPARYGGPADGSVRVVAGDAADAASVAAVVPGHDAVVSAAAVYGEGTRPDVFFPASAHALLAGARGAGVGRLVVVGLSALLPDAAGVPLLSAIPEEHRPFCLAHGAGLEVLRSAGGDVDWLYVSPAGDFDHEGGRGGTYRVVAAGDMATRISYQDFAVALLDEVESPAHHRMHLAVTAG
ncbi:NAD(P)-dependent oxidoreductase [Streptomyces johnsoniae]|uniref:NAD(P)H-binding protein n=1 Tax=Streptomyces johnsoniae TaxID=3075532 RepID=A0ABU2SAU0_9ACTN|nr:NAD(P)H-binding protein [Streptomyces sp. DSM 41886]MDT0444959.1 NAD(P)H-binding protein [Streptomyces sp. DSM 41886]